MSDPLVEDRVFLLRSRLTVAKMPTQSRMAMITR